MKRIKSLDSLFQKLGWMFFILFIYILGMNIPLPIARVTKSYRHLLETTSVGIMSSVSGGNLSQLTLFTVGLTPFMIAMLVIQLLVMSRLFGFDTLSRRQINMVQQWCILFFTILESAVLIMGYKLAPNLTQSLELVTILTAGSLFVVWLGNMNQQFGIGGTITLILVNILSGTMPNLSRSVRYMWRLPFGHLLILALIVGGLALAFFWIAFRFVYYPAKLINIDLASSVKPITYPIGFNTGAMMTYMIGMALFMMPVMLSRMLPHPGILANRLFQVVFAAVVSLSLFYLFAFMQMPPKGNARSLRDSNNYLLNVRPGKPTQHYLAKRLLLFTTFGAVLNTIQLVFGMFGGMYLGKLSGLATIPMTIVMLVMFMGGLCDQLLALTFPYQYDKYIAKEGKIK